MTTGSCCKRALRVGSEKRVFLRAELLKLCYECSHFMLCLSFDGAEPLLNT